MKFFYVTILSTVITLIPSLSYASGCGNQQIASTVSTFDKRLTFSEFQSVKTDIPSCNSESLRKIMYSKAQKYNVNPFLVLSIVYHESSCEKNVDSNKQAKGYMQITYIGAKQYLQNNKQAIIGNIYNSDVNIDIGTYLIHENLMNLDNNVHNSLISYNGGGKYLKTVLNQSQCETGKTSYSDNIVNQAVSLYKQV